MFYRVAFSLFVIVHGGSTFPRYIEDKNPPMVVHQSMLLNYDLPKATINKRKCKMKVTTIEVLEPDIDKEFYEEFDEGDLPRDWKMKRSNDRKRETEAGNKEIISVDSDPVQTIEKESMLDQIDQDKLEFANIKFAPLQKVVLVEGDGQNGRKTPNLSVKELPAIEVVENDELSYD